MSILALRYEQGGLGLQATDSSRVTNPVPAFGLDDEEIVPSKEPLTSTANRGTERH